MKFKYKKYGTGIIRPVIPIDISYKQSSVRHEVLVDSGADRSILDAEIAKILGIEIKKGRKALVSGISSKSEPYYIHPVSINVGGYSLEIEAGFKEGYAWPYSIVGQLGFFNFFIVKFDYRKAVVELTIKSEIN